MPPVSSLTLDYDAVLSTTLFNYRPVLEDQISTSNALLFYLMRRRKDGYESLSALGDRAEIGLMYELGNADSYSGYDELNTDPMDGITAAFFEWRQAAVPIAISGLEEEKNTGKYRKMRLLKQKVKQATLGIQDFFGRRLLQGAGGASIQSPYVSPHNASAFIDPLPLLIKFDPTTSTVIGNINQQTHSWWRNKVKQSAATTFAGLLHELRLLNMDVSKGPGGAPDLHVADENMFALYENALAAAHRNPSYRRADIPFDNIGFKGKPVVWDEFVPDALAGSETQNPASGTWYMINTQFWQIQYSSRRNFTTTPFEKPINQDAKVAHILWLGAAMVSNRRKQGVLSSALTTIAS